MKKVYIGFSDGQNLFSSLIKFATDSDISHTFIMFDEDDNRKIFHARGQSVHYESLQQFLSHSKIITLFSFEVTDEEWQKMKEMQEEDIGKPYSIKEIIGFLWVLFCRIFGMTVENPLSEGDHAYICVDLTAEQIGLKIDAIMTPADFRGWCRRNKRFTLESHQI